MKTLILLVEDDDNIQEFVKIALVDEGYEVLSAPDGLAALHLIDEKKPALILLDLRMPIMDGWTFLRQYRQLPAPRAPVIGISASRLTSPADIPAGIDAYVPKPFDLNDLIALIKQHIQESRASSV